MLEEGVECFFFSALLFNGPIQPVYLCICGSIYSTKIKSGRMKAIQSLVTEITTWNCANCDRFQSEKRDTTPTASPPPPKQHTISSLVLINLRTSGSINVYQSLLIASADAKLPGNPESNQEIHQTLSQFTTLPSIPLPQYHSKNVTSGTSCS